MIRRIFYEKFLTEKGVLDSGLLFRLANGIENLIIICFPSFRSVYFLYLFCFRFVWLHYFRYCFTILIESQMEKKRLGSKWFAKVWIFFSRVSIKVIPYYDILNLIEKINKSEFHWLTFSCWKWVKSLFQVQIPDLGYNSDMVKVFSIRYYKYIHWKGFFFFQILSL